MIIGCPKEVKIKESRIALVPSGAKDLVQDGHDVLVQSNAGSGAGISNDQYEQVGATIVDSADAVWERSDLIVKVKEPIAEEFDRMREGQTLYTYLHLAAVPELTKALMEKKVKAVGYETVQLPNGQLPLLRPMSEVAGRISVQVGAYYLHNDVGGKGVLLSGVAGVRPASVVIIGGGTAGMNAAIVASGMGAHVTVLDVNLNRLEYLDQIFGSKITTLYSNAINIEEAVLSCDVLIGTVLLAGAKAPCLVPEEFVQRMEQGSVIVDVSVDQGGCIETIRPTSHEEPTYRVHDVVHYGVTNMPGAVARTSTFALTNVTMPYLRAIAKYGLEDAAQKDPALAKGINVMKGHVCCEPVSLAIDVPYVPLEKLL